MTSLPIDELVFVFSADSGTLSAVLDSARKLLSLNGCSLCAVTHGLAGEKAEWQECKVELGVPVTYYHRDDLPPTLAPVTEGKLPCVLARVGTDYRLLLRPDSLERCNGKVADLRGRLKHQASLQGLTLALR